VLLGAVMVEVAQADGVRSVGETVRGADVALLVAAAAAEAWRYLFSGALLRLLTGFQYAIAVRISTAALALGALVPGAQLPGGGIAFRELRRRAIPRRRALAVSTALILVVPAASLALLSGPALLLAGTKSDLPSSWRAILDLLGIAALMLAAAILLVVAVGRRAHHAPASLGFGVGAWLAVVAGAVACSLELAISGTVPLGTVLPAMLGVHVLIGVGEAVITVAAVSAVLSTRPDVVRVVA